MLSIPSYSFLLFTFATHQVGRSLALCFSFDLLSTTPQPFRSFGSSTRISIRPFGFINAFAQCRRPPTKHTTAHTPIYTVPHHQRTAPEAATAAAPAAYICTPNSAIRSLLTRKCRPLNIQLSMLFAFSCLVQSRAYSSNQIAILCLKAYHIPSFDSHSSASCVHAAKT